MDFVPDIVPIKKRRYEEIPIEKVKVINSRNRDDEQFDMNVESIDQVGLLKPIRVNDRFLEKSGMYELICGEGRLLAHRRLGREVVKAEVINCTRKEAYLQSLIENIARTKPDSMDFARELKRLHDEGWDCKRIGRITLKSEQYIREYIRLVEQGEERLIQGVEQGVFPIKFATQVASSDDGKLQNILMDAFDEGLVTSTSFAQARQLLAARARSTRSKVLPDQYSVSQLRKDIVDATKTKASYVREAKTKENRFMTLFNGLNELWHDESLRKLLDEEKLPPRPTLKGDFHYETP
ncbi:MAG: ParB N-terminal domain-containing protein [Planctomycetales bacterium]|nr:ParB N-terminal domain-containing protein [Planctomycetales bacterium]